MLTRLKTALQALPSIHGRSMDWLWPLLSSFPLHDSAVEQSLSLLKKLQQLKLDPDHTLATLLVQMAAKTPASFESAVLPPAIENVYRTLRRIADFTPSLRNEEQSELFLKLLIASSQDLQLLSALLALQLCDLERLHEVENPKQHPCAQSTLSVYAPLAERLGIFWIKSELEDIALQHVEPQVYYDLKKKVAKKRHLRSQMIEQITQEIQQLMRQHGIEHEVQGRYKRFYSIYKKLQKVDQEFDRIQDLTGFRVLVHDVQDCYKALGYIHQHWSPKAGRFKDYIAQPKPNGYQSLHTTVTDPKGENIEIQIRTHKMHEIAEFGLAAHWQYKKGQQTTKIDAGLYDNLRRKATSSNDPAVPHLLPNLGMLQDKIYVFTPQNDVVELPHGATPVDFAFAIHTQVGHHITAAKVNQRILKLHHALRTGDRVEVLTSPKQTPRQEWLKFVQTSKAKNKIRYAIREKQRDTNKKLGWELLDKAFKQHGLSLNRIFKEGTFEKTVQQQKNQSMEHIICTVGEGSMKAGEVVQWFPSGMEVKGEEKVIAPHLPKKSLRPPSERVEKYVIAEGLDHMLVRFAKCCAPQAGDSIQGYLTQGRGITIHRAHCPSLQKLDKNRWISVHWKEVLTVEPA